MGEGTDEIFGGYTWYRLDRFLRPFANLPVQVRRILLLGSLMPRWKPLASQAFLAPKEMYLPRYAQLIGMLHPDIVKHAFSEEIGPTWKLRRAVRGVPWSRRAP